MTDEELMARARLRAVTNDFATLADRGAAMSGMKMLSPTFGYGLDEADLKPKGAFSNILMMRQVAEYQTKHHTHEPTMTHIAPDRIAGVVPIVSTRLEDGKMTISVSEFHVTIVPVGNEWKIDRLTMVPFASTKEGLA